MARLFGTDGVRGLANRDITADLALQLSVAAATTLGDRGAFGGQRSVAVVGRDPRASGEFLGAAVCAGLASAGVDVLDAGVLPTPAIAYLTGRMNASIGAVLSASHNAMPDNGIKFLAKGGHKLSDAQEDEILARMDAGAAAERPTGAAVGRIRPFPQGADFYMEHLLDAVPTRLDGLHIVVDAAHGAASQVGPEVFERAGATVDVIGASPDGLNINDGYGSTHLDRLCEAVVARGADLGVAWDGDADRCLAVDAQGQVVDGDQIMAILALSLKEQGRLADDTLVVTVMSNLGLLQAMEREGVTTHQTAVGDRYVLEDMRAHSLSLGGEQSGHVIMLDHGTTGDGVLTALMLSARVVQSGRSLAELAGVMTRLPQTLINVKGVDKDAVDSNEAVRAAVADADGELHGTGRVLLRKSGTEPLVRVMVEAQSEEQAHAVAERLASVVRDHLSL
ncbi:phosphoglucosamine mutase [Arsenicicoccus sp. oral taxon 190]|uniref:phosphoglucosamine mutase n=1 Tax=Arsenicicoccus sp. oral taxon 190 TaxID=1658671 RepID=UPI00067A0B43|nr:phosphoglucosamine mutase [Arsenicicoccus sp. oral taxon 190]AKT51315.1 phosphoglucosamine mutase [Arsenicicoccus sp. oral taxon 190]